MLYRYQINRGRHVIHEHPWGASSWNVECMQRLLDDRKVMIAKVDQCRYGLEATDSNGELGPARKRTGFASSSWTVVEELDGTCGGMHATHSHLLGG